MVELRIEFDVFIYKSFVEKEITILEFLIELLNEGGNYFDEFDEGTKGDIIAYLLSYHSNEGGAPQCKEFFITDEEYNDDLQTGAFSINYNVAYYFSCSDMDNDEDHHENVKFKIDIPNQELVLEFMEHERRTTREEF